MRRPLNYVNLLDPGRVLRAPLLQPIFPGRNSPYLNRKIPEAFEGEISVIYALVPKGSPWGKSQQEESSTSSYTPFICRVQPVDMRDYIRRKGNQNISFTGASQHGKSYLTRYFFKHFDDQQVIIFSFKPEDQALKVGIEARDARRHLPPIFKDPDAFAQAYYTTFFKETTPTGIQLQPTGSILVELAEVTQSSEKRDWETFFASLERMRKRAPKNEQASLDAIYRNTQQLEIEQATIGDSIDYRKSVVLDFSTIANTEARTFYAELVLRQLWNDLSSTPPRRMNVTICIDEAHRMTKQPFSIVHKISQEIGHRGRLWLITQNLTDIHPESRTNMATKFSFLAGDKDLLLYQHLDILHDALGRLRPYQFIDLQFPRFNEYVPVFQYVSERGSTTVAPAWRFEPPASVEEEGQGKGGGPAEGEERGKEVEEMKEKPEIAIDEGEIKVLLPNYWTPIIRQIAREKPDVPFNELKFAVSQMLKRINAGKIELDEEQDQPYHSFYYARGENISQLHEYLQSKAKLTLGKLYRLKHEAKSGELSNPDLEYVNDKDEPIFDVEVETGLSNSNLGRLRERIVRSIGNNVKVFVVVPNEEQSAKYTKSLLELIVEHKNCINVVTLRELKQLVMEVRNGEHAGRDESQGSSRVPLSDKITKNEENESEQQ